MFACTYTDTSPEGLLWVFSTVIDIFALCYVSATCGGQSKCMFINLSPVFVFRTLSNWVYEFDKWAPTVVKVSYKVSSPFQCFFQGEV